MSQQIPFWQAKTLEELSSQEWEKLCDGCGRCCLVKLEDEDTGDIYTTSVSCTLFDGDTCRCKDYANRFAKVSDCLDLTVSLVRKLDWLPDTCAYRLRAEGKDLPDWHPLVSGDKNSVHRAGISVAGQTINEDLVDEAALGDYLKEWPIPAKNEDSNPKSGKKAPK